MEHEHTDAEVEAAIDRVSKILDAAKNSNHAGEVALVRMVRADAAAPALYEALDSIVMLCGRTGDHFEDFEEQASAFQCDTGKMRPGKDVPAAADDFAATHEEYLAWVESKLAIARAALAAARGE